MLTSICPLGERARGQRWWLTTAAYITASAAAGALLGGALGGLGALLLPWAGGTTALALFALVGAGGLMLDTGVARLRVPGPRRQVNEDWLNRYRGWVYGAGFGAQLGAAFTTIVMVSAVYLVFAAAALTADATAGALLGGTFGLARALPLLAVARVGDGGALRSFMARMQRGVRPAHRSVLAAQAVAVTVAVVAIGTGA